MKNEENEINAEIIAYLEDNFDEFAEQCFIDYDRDFPDNELIPIPVSERKLLCRQGVECIKAFLVMDTQWLPDHELYFPHILSADSTRTGRGNRFQNMLVNQAHFFRHILRFVWKHFAQDTDDQLSAALAVIRVLESYGIAVVQLQQETIAAKAEEMQRDRLRQNNEASLANAKRRLKREAGLLDNIYQRLCKGTEALDGSQSQGAALIELKIFKNNLPDSITANTLFPPSAENEETARIDRIRGGGGGRHLWRK